MIEVTGAYVRNSFWGEFFTSYMLIIMTTIFLVFIILLILNRKDFFEPFRKISRKTWLTLLVIFIVGFALRNDSYSHGFSFDGLHYADAGSFFYKTGIFVKGCAIGNAYDCKLYHQPLFPAGFPYAVTLIYYVFGESSMWTMMLSAFAGSLAIILVYLITYLLFRKEEIGLYTSLVFALVPLEILISGSASVRPFSGFFMALTVLFFLLALRRSSVKLWSLFAITLSYSIYVRQENSLLLIPMLLLYFWENRSVLRSFRIGDILAFFKKYWIPIAIFIVSQIPVQHWILFGLGDWTLRSEPIFALKYFPSTAPIILTLFFTEYFSMEAFFNPLTSILLFAGLYFVFRGKEKINNSFIWLWLLSFFLMEAFFFQCKGYPESHCIGNLMRHMMTLTIPYSMISGFVLFKINERVKVNRHAFLAGMAVVIILISGISMPTTIFKDARMEETYVGSLISAVNRTGTDCLVFIGQIAIPNSDLLGENERKWVDEYIIMNGTHHWVWEEVENSTCMYFFEDFNCKQEFEGGEVGCNFIYKKFDLEFLFVEGDIKPIKVYRLHIKE